MTSRSLRRRLSRLQATAALALFGASAAWAAFGDPVRLSRSGEEVGAPQVSIAANGRALVVWSGGPRGDYQRIQARARAGGAFGPIEYFSPAGQSAASPQVALDSDGDALVVFSVFDVEGANYRIQARARSKAGVVGPIETLSDPVQRDAPLVAMDADGDALVAWRRSDGVDFRVQARARSAGGVLGRIQTLSEDGGDTHSPQVTMNANGDAVLLWVSFDGRTGRGAVRGRIRSAAGQWGPIRTIFAGADSQSRPQIAIDGAGNALIVHERPIGDFARLEARALSGESDLGPVQILAVDGCCIFEPRVAMDTIGTAQIVWRKGTISVLTRFKTGELGPTQRISDASAGEPEIAVDEDGNTLIAWRKFETSGGHGTVQARTRSADGALGPVQDVSLRTEDSLDSLAVAVASDRALAVWRRYIGQSDELRVEAAVGP